MISNTTAPAGGGAIAACQATVTNFADEPQQHGQHHQQQRHERHGADRHLRHRQPAHQRSPRPLTPSPSSPGTRSGSRSPSTTDGIGPVNNVVVTDTLPTNAALGINWSRELGPDCSIAGGVLTCNFGTLAQGASASVHLTSPTTAPAPGAPAIAACQVTVTNFATNVNNTAAGDELGELRHRSDRHLRHRQPAHQPAQDPGRPDGRRREPDRVHDHA